MRVELAPARGLRLGAFFRSLGCCTGLSERFLNYQLAAAIEFFILGDGFQIIKYLTDPAVQTVTFRVDDRRHSAFDLGARLSDLFGNALDLNPSLLPGITASQVEVPNDISHPIFIIRKLPRQIPHETGCHQPLKIRSDFRLNLHCSLLNIPNFAFRATQDA